jgi:hypothetical protein
MHRLVIVVRLSPATVLRRAYAHDEADVMSAAASEALAHICGYERFADVVSLVSGSANIVEFLDVVQAVRSPSSLVYPR